MPSLPILMFANALFMQIDSCSDKIEDEDDSLTCANNTARRNFLAINGKSPGPTIQVNINVIFLQYKKRFKNIRTRTNNTDYLSVFRSVSLL